MAARENFFARLRAICLALRWPRLVLVQGAAWEPSGADRGGPGVPPDLGSKGWVGMWLVPLPDRDEVAILVRRNYRIVAPKRLGISSDR